MYRYRYKDNVYYEITAEQCTGCGIYGGAGGGVTAALTMAGSEWWYGWRYLG